MQVQNVYSVLGGSTHDVLEKIMNGEATEADLLPTIQNDLDKLDMLGVQFPKGRDGSDSIRENWITDMTHFCNTYKAPKGDFETEQFFLYKTPHDIYLQGYIDLIRKNKDGTVDIYDYKTSSMYKGKDVKEHGRQLIIYALALEQQGYKVRNVGWIFLKYCEVRYMGYKTARSKSKSKISQIVERRNIAKDLSKQFQDKLRERGYTDIDIDFIISDALDSNSVPEEIADEFTIVPCVVKYNLDDDTRSETISYIENTVNNWESLSRKEQDYPHISFTKTLKNGKEVDDTFFCRCLCGYQNSCPHLYEYLDKDKDKDDDDIDLFA